MKKRIDFPKIIEYNIAEVRNMSFKFTVVILKEEDWYVAKCIENSVASQGKTVEEATANLKEAIELYYEDNAPETVAAFAFVTTLEVAI